MNIIINQQSKDIPDQCSLEQLLTQVLSIPVAGLAVAVDETVIPSTDWPAYMLREADRVMLIRATQGGWNQFAKNNMVAGYQLPGT